MEEIKPVSNAPLAGAEKEPEPQIPAPESKPAQEPPKEPEPKKELDSEAVVELLEAHDKALAAAETKIISLKRRLKGIGAESPEGEDLREQILKLQEEIDSLKGAKAEEEDKDLEEIKALRRRNSELIAAFRAKKTASKDSLGSSQAPLKEEEDPTKGYSQADLVVLNRVADRKGLSLKEYLKTLGKK